MTSIRACIQHALIFFLPIRISIPALLPNQFAKAKFPHAPAKIKFALAKKIFAVA